MDEPEVAERREGREQPSPDLTKHQPVLDGIRGLAILLVLFHHAAFCVEIDTGPFYDRLLYRFTEIGRTGVDLFFVLSGFLITGILLQTRDNAHYFRSFYMRRTLRIFPLYYAFLIGLFLIGALFLHDNATYQALHDKQFWFWLYLQNWYVVAVEHWDPAIWPISHFWTLAVEEQFYLVWPLVVWLVSRRMLMAVCGACVAGALGTRIVLHMIYPEMTSAAITPNTFLRMDTLAFGALLAAYGQSHGLRSFSRHATVGLLIGLAAFAFIVMPRSGMMSKIIGSSVYTLLMIGYGSLMLASLTWASNHPLVRTLNWSPMRWMGRYSYGIYVFHWPVMYLMADLVDPKVVMLGPSYLVPFFLFLVASSLVTVLLAVISWHVLEKHFLNLKKYFPR